MPITMNSACKTQRVFRGRVRPTCFLTGADRSRWGMPRAGFRDPPRRRGCSVGGDCHRRGGAFPDRLLGPAESLIRCPLSYTAAASSQTACIFPSFSKNGIRVGDTGSSSPHAGRVFEMAFAGALPFRKRSHLSPEWFRRFCCGCAVRLSAPATPSVAVEKLALKSSTIQAGRSPRENAARLTNSQEKGLVATYFADSPGSVQGPFR